VIDGYQRCVCGELELADGCTAELAGVTHRLDGPCYHEQVEVTMHEIDVMPGMVIRPGDVLIIGCDEPLQLVSATRLRESLMERMPGLADVVIVPRPLSIDAVYRANAPESGGPVL
jgi:hypothetical protein